MFNKIGTPQPLTILAACVACGGISTKVINGQTYCDSCAQNVENLNASVISQMEEPISE